MLARIGRPLATNPTKIAFDGGLLLLYTDACGTASLGSGCLIGRSRYGESPVPLLRLRYGGTEPHERLS